MQVLRASAAVGVASAFRAPIGGVLFSVEVTGACYNVQNYSYSFWCAVIGATTVYLISATGNDHTMCESDYVNQTGWSDSVRGCFQWSRVLPDRGSGSFHKTELPIFAFMGVMAGLIGARSRRPSRRCFASIASSVGVAGGSRVSVRAPSCSSPAAAVPSGTAPLLSKPWPTARHTAP